MNIIYASSEGFPFVKTGGLGDVTYSLPKELAKNKNLNLCVFLPYYSNIKYNNTFDIQYVTNFEVNLSWRNQYCGIFKSTLNNVTYYFIDNNYYFDRSKPYGDYDDGEKFAFFSKAVLESIYKLNLYPDIIHCHDWQTALIPIFLKGFYSCLDNFRNTKTVFTIHNIEYQGIVHTDFYNEVLGLGDGFFNILHYDNELNFMKGAIILADKVTTVSKTYSHEIKYAYFAHGLHNIINEYSYKIVGIINGIDMDLYNSETDKNIISNFNIHSLDKKVDNKLFLQDKLGLPVNADIPMVCMISRLVSHKGLDLVECVADDILQLPLQFVILGNGEYHFEEFFKHLQYRYPHKVSSNILFDNCLANQIYAGADFFLMPSKTEPCGLSQLIAMRYGTIPIVRETGGLFDTVTYFDEQTSNNGRGFTFKTYNAHDMLHSINNAINVYHNKPILKKLMVNDLNYNSSWQQSANEYLTLYKSI